MTDEEYLAGMAELAEQWEREVMDGLEGLISMTVEGEEESAGPVTLWCRTHDECYLAGEGIDPPHNVERCGELSQYFPSARSG